MSRTIAGALSGLVNACLTPLSRRRRDITRALIVQRLIPTPVAATPHGPLRFFCPNREALEYPRDLLTREPEINRWIDGFEPGEVMWDIGANVGAYSLYAALRTGAAVLAFEPAAPTFALLARNVEINGLDRLIRPYCIALCARTRLDTLNMAHTYASSVLHAFGHETDATGGAIDARFRQSVPGFAVDDFVRLFDPPLPDHVKIDVDGIEAEIIAGGQGLLSRPQVRSVMVEISGAMDTPDNRAIIDGLAAAGLTPGAGQAGPNVLFAR